ncbi:hypothetical protein Aperf_G00000013651 [Anoplocephala perfoliata]
MVDDGSPSSEEPSSSKSQPEVMRNNKVYTSMLPETAALPLVGIFTFNVQHSSYDISARHSYSAYDPLLVERFNLRDQMPSSTSQNTSKSLLDSRSLRHPPLRSHLFYRVFQKESFNSECREKVEIVEWEAPHLPIGMKKLPDQIARDDPYEAASLPQMRSAFFSAMVAEES